MLRSSKHIKRSTEVLPLRDIDADKTLARISEGCPRPPQSSQMTSMLRARIKTNSCPTILKLLRTRTGSVQTSPRGPPGPTGPAQSNLVPATEPERPPRMNPRSPKQGPSNRGRGIQKTKPDYGSTSVDLPLNKFGPIWGSRGSNRPLPGIHQGMQIACFLKYLPIP